MLGKISLAPGGQKAAQQPDPQATTVPQPAATPAAVTLSGYWQVAFQAGNKTMQANMRLEQTGNQFSGDGTDDPSNRAFVIEQGQLNGDQVTFTKKYQDADPAANPPVQYSGKFEIANQDNIQGPYMSGTYSTVYKGQPIQGSWESLMVSASPTSDGGQAPSSSGSVFTAGAGSQSGGKAPHLSGKWDVAYERDFKTIKSTMYLEQDGGNIKGHGEDKNTKEKFLIEKGWYHFPRLTVVRKYVKGKGAASDRTIMFKAEVQMVNDAGYQGPYMHGKTQEGGEWEAQLYK